MAARPPSADIRAMLVEDDIALWDAAHYTTAASKNPGRPTMKDPVRVVLLTPRAPDRQFTGTGATTNEAVLNALATNPGLRDLPGVSGALGRLQNALHALEIAMWQERERVFVAGGGNADDFDIPF